MRKKSISPRAIRVIFLDIDGVLINSKTKTVPDPACIATLNSITAITGAYIVVSSVRKKDKGIANVLAEWGVEGHVLDRTPDLSWSGGGVEVGASREDEIQKWLYDRLDVHSYVVLDDSALDLGDMQDRHIKTSFETGLTTEDARRALTMLTVRMRREYVYSGGVIDIHPSSIFFGEWWIKVIEGNGSHSESFTDVKLAHAKRESLAVELGWEFRSMQETMLWWGALYEPDLPAWETYFAARRLS